MRSAIDVTKSSIIPNNNQKTHTKHYTLQMPRAAAMHINIANTSNPQPATP